MLPQRWAGDKKERRRRKPGAPLRRVGDDAIPERDIARDLAGKLADWFWQAAFLLRLKMPGDLAEQELAMRTLRLGVKRLTVPLLQLAAAHRGELVNLVSKRFLHASTS